MAPFGNQESASPRGPTPPLPIAATSALSVALLILMPAIRAPHTASTGHPPAPFDVPGDKVVYLVPMGALQENDVQFIAQGLESRLGVGVALMPPSPTPASAWLNGRGQYSARGVMDSLFLARPDDAWRVLGVTSEDLTSDDVDMVYGFASSRDRVAVISTFRFRQDLAAASPGRQAHAHDQLIRAAVHELAHTANLPHCPSPGCLMGAISHRDQITPSTHLCERCAGQLGRNLEAPRDRRTEALDRGDGLLERGYAADALALYLTADRPNLTDLERAELENRLGAALLSLERVAEGEQHIGRAVALAPTFAPARYNLALIEVYRGDEAEALATLQAGMALDEDPKSRHGFAARFYLDALGDPGSALIEYRAFKEAGGADAYLDAHLGALDRPDVFVFSSREAGVIVGRAR